jgi:hypothetical protein
VFEPAANAAVNVPAAVGAKEVEIDPALTVFEQTKLIRLARAFMAKDGSSIPLRLKGKQSGRCCECSRDVHLCSLYSARANLTMNMHLYTPQPKGR